MPIEIRELVIKTTITDGGTQSGSSNSNASPAAADDKTVQKIVDEVMQKISDKNER